MLAAQQRLNSLAANRTAPGLPQASQVIDLHDFPGMHVRCYGTFDPLSTETFMPHSLPQALLIQAQTRNRQIALRYKKLGIWQTRTWGEVAQDVDHLAEA